MLLHPPYVVIKQKKMVRDIILHTAILHGLSITKGSGPGLRLGAGTEQHFGLLLKHRHPELKYGHKCLCAWASAQWGDHKRPLESGQQPGTISLQHCAEVLCLSHAQGSLELQQTEKITAFLPSSCSVKGDKRLTFCFVRLRDNIGLHKWNRRN